MDSKARQRSEASLVSRARKRIWDNPYSVLAFASLCWSGNHIVGRAITGHIPPLTISTIRRLVPVFIIWFVARSEIQTDWPSVRQHWGIVLWLGITGGTLFQHTSIRRSSTHNRIECLNSKLVGSRSYHRRRSAHISRPHPLCPIARHLNISDWRHRYWTHGDPEVLTQLEFNFGDLIAVLAMAVFAIYVAYLRMRPPTHWLTFLFVLGIISAITTMPFAIFEIARGEVVELTQLTILAALYVSTFPSLLAFAVWNRGVELIGPNKRRRSCTWSRSTPRCSPVSSWAKTSDYSMWRGCC